MSRHLFFDLDGTLTDPAKGIFSCLTHALVSVGLKPPSEDQLAGRIGPPLHESLRELVGEEHADLFPAALETYRARYAEIGMFENVVYPGIHGALETVEAAGWTLWVVTSKPTVFARPILAHFGLSMFFAGVHGSELSGEHANKQDLIAHVLKTEGIAAADATMIGDRSYDVVGARSNGVRALGVLWGYGTRDELLTAGADAVVANVYELVEFLR